MDPFTAMLLAQIGSTAVNAGIQQLSPEKGGVSMAAPPPGGPGGDPNRQAQALMQQSQMQQQPDKQRQIFAALVRSMLNGAMRGGLQTMQQPSMPSPQTGVSQPLPQTLGPMQGGGF